MVNESLRYDSQIGKHGIHEGRSFVDNSGIIFCIFLKMNYKLVSY